MIASSGLKYNRKEPPTRQASGKSLFLLEEAYEPKEFSIKDAEKQTLEDAYRGSKVKSLIYFKKDSPNNSSDFSVQNFSNIKIRILDLKFLWKLSEKKKKNSHKNKLRIRNTQKLLLPVRK